MDRKTLAIVMTLVVAGSGHAWAQDTVAIKKALSRVASDETISLFDASGRRVTGRLSGSTDTVVTLDGSRDVAVNRVVRITVKDPKSDGALRGALIGGGAGLIGALALNSIYANEGTGSGAGVLALIGVGIGAGAGIGALGDSMMQKELYRAAGVPRFSPEVRVRAAAHNRRSGVVPVAGLSWSMMTPSGLGVEVNADRTQGAADGEGRGFSFDGRALYAFGRGRFQPYISGGAGFVQYHHNYTAVNFAGGVPFPAQRDIQGIAPVLGGGIRLQAARHLVIRPEVSWFVEPADSGSPKVVARAGMSVGYGW